ncbi:MAG TPA: hypothetical protein VN915_09815 [Elusimicrobiota bacterium]|nr:hypothetical protein [Elusimicrobiota bacterium]
MKKQPFHNFVVDHMTFLTDPELYKTTYALFRIVFGVSREDLIYEKRSNWPGQTKPLSMTFAARVGVEKNPKVPGQSIFAVVQPTEPAGKSSHVRTMLKNRGGGCHWQHIALRTPDLISFHRYALDRGVNFITPVLKDAEEDLIQVFSGEWMVPGGRPTATFFEFVQRDPSAELLKQLETASNREAWFRDKTFLGLYGEKEKEYQTGKATPFIDDELARKIAARLDGLEVFEIEDALLEKVEADMLDYAAAKTKAKV